MKSFIQKLMLVPNQLRQPKQTGTVLVITLLTMLVLMLLGLSLAMQSNTEHRIASNEQDAFQDLARAEEVLNWGNRVLRNWVDAQHPSPSNLTAVLTGQIGTAPNRNNFFGFRTLDTAKNRSNLNDGAEETTSGVEVYESKEYEVFRLGVDSDGDGNFDADTPRTVILARVEDNFDDGSTQNTTDADFRIRMIVHAFYPVFVDANGLEINNVDVRPQAVRTLIGRFWPGGHYAIRTDGDLEIWGSLQLCGECGSAHANGEMKASRSGSDNIQVCGEATGSGTYTFNGGGTIGGDKGLAPEIFIPVVNPYDKIYVPDGSNFAQTVTLRTGHPTDPNYLLTCPAPSINDPGSSKYFAMVRNTSGPNRMAQVWKAYPDFANAGKWYWRLIDEQWNPGNPGAGSGINEDLTAVLDNCGRVVSCTAWGCSPDQIRIGGVWTALPGGGVTDGGNSEFYGWGAAGNFGTTACSGDNIAAVSGSTPEPYVNDYWTNNFLYVNSVSSSVDPNNPITTGGAISTRNCAPETCPAVPPLPGTGSPESSPGNSDFKTTTRLTDAGWQISGGKIYSPLYGAVLFIYGDVDLSGNLSNIVFNNGTCGASGCASGAQADISNSYASPPNTWRLSVISYGHADIGGGVRYSPAFGTNAAYQYAVVAGRDINLRGNSNNFDCNGTDCDGTPSGTAADYSGIFVVHEQLNASGNVGVNGFMIAEDRVDCDDFVNATGGALNNQGTGNIQVHYDCANPADPWAAKGVRLREWEEWQQ